MEQILHARHSELTHIGNVTNEAAAIAISAEQYNTALEWLEQGRSIVYNQLLQLRTPIDTLHAVQPTLANDLLCIAKALEHTSNHRMDIQVPLTPLDRQLSMEEIAQDHHHLAGEWEILVERARGLPGFADFLRPRKLAQLLRAANAGPVVVLNVHECRCDALALVSGLDDIMHIPLDSLSYKTVRALQWQLNQLFLTDTDSRPM